MALEGGQRDVRGRLGVRCSLLHRNFGSPRSFFADGINTDSGPQIMGYLASWISLLTTAFASILFALIGTQASDCQWLHRIVVISWTIGPFAWLLTNVAVRTCVRGSVGMDLMEKHFHRSILFLRPLF